MRIQVVAIAIALLMGCHSNSERPGGFVDAGGGNADAATTATDHLKEIFDEVDGARITQVLHELSGEVPVTVNGASITLGCGGNGQNSFDFWPLGNQLSDIVAAYSPLHVKRGCLAANSDHFAMAEIGVPAVCTPSTTRSGIPTSIRTAGIPSPRSTPTT